MDNREPEVVVEIIEQPHKNKVRKNRRDKIVSSFSRRVYNIIQTQAIILSLCTLAIIGIMVFGVYIYIDMGYTFFS